MKKHAVSPVMTGSLLTEVNLLRYLNFRLIIMTIGLFIYGNFGVSVVHEQWFRAGGVPRLMRRVWSSVVSRVGYNRNIVRNAKSPDVDVL